MKDQPPKPLDSEEILRNMQTTASLETGEKYPFTLQQLAPILNAVFSHLNHLEIYTNDQLGDAPFRVTLLNQGEESFPRGKFVVAKSINSDLIQEDVVLENAEKQLPTYKIKIEISPTLNIISDLPRLVSELQELHNSKVKAIGESNPMCFIDTSQRLAEYWEFMSLRLSEFIQKRRSRISTLGSDEISDEVIGDDFLGKSLHSFTEVCHKIAEGFNAVRSTENELLLPRVNAEIVYKQQWNKLETRLAVMLRALETATLFEPPENPRKKTQLFQHFRANP